MIRLKYFLRLAACLGIVSLATPAYASNLFLLQLGLFSSSEAANSQFDQVMEAHGKLLEGKRYISKQGQSIAGGESTWRVLVGPYENRKLASRACAELKEAGQDCFVVETAAINMDEVEAGAELAAKETVKKPETEATESTESAVSEETPASDSSWDWFNDNADDDEEKKKEKPAEEERKVNSNININTHSVYEEKQAPKEEIQLNIAESISSLFEGEETAQAAATEEAPSEEAASVTEKLETPVAADTNLNQESETAHTGEVEIAEAIPVPLTEPENVPVTQSAPLEPPADAKEEVPQSPAEAAPVKATKEETTSAVPSASSAETQPYSPAPAETQPIIAAPAPAAPIHTTQRVPLTQYMREGVTSRMLQISVFENDRAAFQCLNTLQGSMPSASMLRSRIIKSTTGQAVLRLGPVNDAELEEAVCKLSLECGEQVQCRIIAEREMHQPRRTRNAQPLERGRRENTNPHAPMPRNLTPIPEAPATYPANGPVWVQLGTSSSESDAKSKFETLKSLYPDLLKGYTPTINSPENESLGGRVYRLRIGTFENRNKAQSLCAALSARGVGCLVLSK